MTLRTFILLFVLVLGAMSWLSDLTPPQIVAAADIYVIDGDTIDVNGERYRLVGFDTPETYRAACDAERQLGDQATGRLRNLVQSADEITLAAEDHRDKYGRGLGILSVDGRDVGAILISEGLARLFTSGSRQPWC